MDIAAYSEVFSWPDMNADVVRGGVGTQSITYHRVLAKPCT